MSSFRISKKVTWDFSCLLEVLQAHCRDYINESRKSRLPITEYFGTNSKLLTVN